MWNEVPDLSPQTQPRNKNKNELKSNENVF